MLEGELATSVDERDTVAARAHALEDELATAIEEREAGAITTGRDGTSGDGARVQWVAAPPVTWPSSRNASPPWKPLPPRPSPNAMPPRPGHWRWRISSR